ncbi:MAG: hypothetical protein A2W98_03920 [Bacteroidetes bacterium GWF2_33_38]|nr:MAG: hypothetical protein A2W98_03920 [Bacteroidetes bacterium GWF2_33_38]OFY76203.1 MAG: hypothetical protein A2265_10745 [Bacteroidetes bacterium RIFOXYA12_FULL_33_9]OFY92108.1 MAG: hypothetical protein A2236_07615 [Bacteroidetes bacterium RIFOXYA2_FULL_33_7]
MKKTIFTLAIATLMSGTMLMSCQTSSEKVDSAEGDLIEASKALKDANEEYLKDVEDYKKIIAEKTEANERSIAEFKARIAKDKKDAKLDYKIEISDLEQKNGDLKKKMQDYKSAGKEQWDAFKIEFNNDMEALNKVINDAMSAI